MVLFEVVLYLLNLRRVRFVIWIATPALSCLSLLYVLYVVVMGPVSFVQWLNLLHAVYWCPWTYNKLLEHFKYRDQSNKFVGQLLVIVESFRYFVKC